MKKLTSFFALTAATIFVSPAMAGPATNALINCVSDSTTGKDRKELAKWVFVAMTAHPDIQPMSRVSETNRDELDKKLAKLATTLLTESCQMEAKLATEQEGPTSIEAAFGVLGKLAMQELMSNPSVSASFTRYTKYLDRAKFDAAFVTK
ncbi:MAG: hypothetical protein KBF81_03830 [Aquabacterium sp.]|nr:hypothetical protein [Aquabacterium sp.]MBP9062887.1 hypothetical protein [Aquabacterium sp.]